MWKGVVNYNFGKDYKFIRVRPDWLKNLKTDRNMEIDLFCSELNLGIEVNGDQHYHYIPHFHRNGIVDFHNQLHRDTLKSELCLVRGVHLISISTKDSLDKKVEEIEEYIRNFELK